MDTSPDQAGHPFPGFRLQLLGPVTGWRHAGEIELGPPLQRAALCMLATGQGQVVTKEKLIRGLWGDAAPKTADQSIYTYIAKLRRVFEPSRGRRGPFSVLVQMGKGYTLLPGSVHVDVADFEHRLAEARRHRANDDVQAWLRALEAALRMWNGPALSGVPGPFLQIEAHRLEQLRRAAQEDRAEALLQLGRHREAAEILPALLTEDPLRERAGELLMLALYRCGRQAEALSVFHDTRRSLAEHLGVDPGEALQRCHELILRGDPSLDPPAAREALLGMPSPNHVAPPVPHQLPRDIKAFVGRAGHLERLRCLLAPRGDDVPPAVVTVTGMAGTGKSALAVHAAHAVHDRFPDGQLYVNLLGATPGVEQLRPAEVLGRFLRALGVRPDGVPYDVDEATALLRSVLNGRRVLIVLDDAAGPGQVHPFLDLPAGVAVLVTSRESFTMTDGCVRIELGRMTGREGVGVLTSLLGERRVGPDGTDATRLVALCDGLPLALRLAAARLAARPHWGLADLVARFEDGGRILHELEVGDVAVRTSLQLSYDQLSQSPREMDRVAARALCHLGVLHVPQLGPDVAAALLDVPVHLADRALERLVEVHLMEPGEHGRFMLHDLVRLFAIQLAESRLTSEERAQSLLRAIGFYGISVRQAATLADPHRVHPPYDFVACEPVRLGGIQEAHEWLEAERENILAVIGQATSSKHRAIAEAGAHLVFSFHWPLTSAGHANDVLSSAEQALRASERLGDRRLLALSHGYVALGLHQVNMLPQALEHLRTELPLQRALGDRFAEMRTLGNLSVISTALGHCDEGLRTAQAQLSIAREIGSAVGERHALMSVGHAQRGLGRLTAAMTMLQEAHGLARDAGDLMHEANALIAMARVDFERNDPRSAATRLENALACDRRTNFRTREPVCLAYLGKALRLMGRFREARTRLEEALAVARELGDGKWEDIAAKELALVDAERGSAGAEREEEVHPVGHG